MSENALIIFTRNPELGKVKTRLAASIGNVEALEVYTKLLRHTREVCLKVGAERFLFYDKMIVEKDDWENISFTKMLQHGDNLGERMKNAFAEIFDRNHPKAIIVGSDLPELSSDIIYAAFAALDESEFVIGPAEDGGYYLLGMKSLFGSVFDIQEWGTSIVRRETMEKLKGKSVAILPMLNDIDTFEDLQNSPDYKNL